MSITNLIAENCLIEADELFCIARDINLIYRVNISTGELQFVDSLPDEYSFMGRLGSDILLLKDKMIFVPVNASKIYVRDINKREWNKIDFEEIADANLTKFMSGLIYKDQLFMFGSFYPAIVTIDLQKERQVASYKVPYIELQDKQKELGDCFFRKDFAVIDNKVYMASCVKNCIYIFDMEQNEATCLNIGDSSLRFSGIAYDGKNFWLTSRDSLEFYKWVPDRNELKAYKISNVDKHDYYLGGVIYDGVNVIMTGMNNKCSYVINPFAEKTMESMKTIDASYVFVKCNGKYDYCMNVDGHIDIRMVDNIDQVYKRLNINVKRDEVNKFILDKTGLVVENNKFTLENFLELL